MSSDNVFIFWYNICMDKLKQIKIDCENCKKCPLFKTKHNVVFSSGNESAKIFLIGEAPGHDEDMSGLPFVGMAGKILDKYLSLSEIDRDKDLYISNIVKCRPPENRKPKNAEKQACLNYLEEQILTVNPTIIILCGGTAAESFLGKVKMSDVHGKIFEISVREKKYRAMPIYHPSPLCRVKDKEQIMVKDLSQIKKLVL